MLPIRLSDDDPDTKIIGREVGFMEEPRLLFCSEFWSRDGYHSGSVIFREEDVEGLPEEELFRLARKAI